MCKSIKVMLFLALTGLSGVASSALPVPDSEINYPGASTTKAFVAKEPYAVNIQGSMRTLSLGGASRSHDFGGTAPFINPQTNKNDPFVFQAWSSGLVDWSGSKITNNGVPGRIGKTKFGNNDVTMLKYNAGDDIAYQACRSKLAAYPIPPRTHVRWELEVAFGKADGANDWTLTPSGQSPVLFWQVKSNENQTHPPLALNVDTDSRDATKLMITVFQRTGTATRPIELGRIGGIPRNTLIPIVMEAFLDERAIRNGGKGIWQVWVNNTLVVEEVGPTLTVGSDTHEWSIETYLWNEPYPYKHNRATFYKTARMMVFPADMSTAAPAPAPAQSVDTTKSTVNISSYFVNNINKFDATVNWTTNVPTSAVIYYGRTTSLGSSLNYTKLTTDHSLVLQPLWDGFTYYYKIVAKDSSGATYTSPMSSFKTRW